jgi:pimeloyl-ACP methyl ester carboxylesterase
MAKPNPPNPPNPFRHLRSTDLQGLAKLATQATVNVTKMAEGVTQSVWSTMGAPSGKEKDQTRGITGLVYKSIQSVAQLVGKGTESLLTSLQPLLEKIDQEPKESAPREAVLAALNGVMGDRLVESDNPLATPMTLRFQNQALNWDAMPNKALLTGKVLIVVHGLCMNDLQWTVQPFQAGGESFNHAENLATKLGYTPVYVRYNTGLHTSQNGQTLSNQLEMLSALWPKPLTEISVLVHSMGGLVARSAVHLAQRGKRQWVNKLKNIVFLGTPHHGAPLEKAGNWVDVLLGSTPFSAPFKKLAELRSSGITDLRFGNVLDGDWQGTDRFKPQTKQELDNREHLPLPDGVACFTVAATLAAKRSLLAERLIGDGLVPLNSALGVNSDPTRSLVFAKSSQLIVYSTNHMALLGRAEVGEQLVVWLS